jgi:7,8-dihydropterin-6-yl-methyl-4-(beta-D-ribofuranosyl)aminobenzene 5'-phosphate synthase
MHKMPGLEKVGRLNVTIVCDNSVKVGARGLLGEHGFAALIAAGDDGILFDTGQSGTALCNNLRALRVALPGTVVLSHGHFDHSGGLRDYARMRGAPSLLYTHTDAFKKRLKKAKGRLQEIGMPFDKGALMAAGYEIRESDSPQLVTNWLMTSGAIERRSFETPETEFFVVEGEKLKKDPFLDDSAVAAHVQGKGLVIVTGCAHSGVVNTARHFKRLLGEERIHAIIGGFHLVDASETKMEKTIAALEELAPELIVAGHCTGKGAAHALKCALKERITFGEAGMKLKF